MNTWPSNVLGSLCFTPDQRMLFFSGLIERKINWYYSNKGFQSIRSSGFVDHITLERGFQRGHVTVLEHMGNKLHMYPFKTKSVGKHILYWFGLTIQDKSVLETTLEELRIILTSPSKDSERRAELLKEAREKAIFHLVTLDNMPLKKGEFLHFDFFISPKDVDVKALPCFVPHQEPIVHNYTQAFKEGTYFRSHPVFLEEIKEKAWVVVSKHVGKVIDKAILHSPKQDGLNQRTFQWHFLYVCYVCFCLGLTGVF